MGTRAITNIYNRADLLVTIYRQSDGYLSGHGLEIAKAFKGTMLVNGITFDRPRNLQVNGMGCAAARLIAFLKDDMEAGGIYINRPDPDATEDYTYSIFGDTMKPEDGMNIRVTSYGENIYEGPLDGFDPVKIEESRADDD